MHSHHIRGVRLQPSLQLISVRDVDGQEAAVALVVTVVFGVAAVVFCFTGADEIDAGPFGGLQLLPEFGAPANDFGDAVAKGHVADGGVGGLGGGCGQEGGEGEGEGLEVDHDDGDDFLLKLLPCVVKKGLFFSLYNQDLGLFLQPSGLYGN
jgi:hypothetical protein